MVQLQQPVVIFSDDRKEKVRELMVDGVLFFIFLLFFLMETLSSHSFSFVTPLPPPTTTTKSLFWLLGDFLDSMNGFSRQSH